LRAFPHAKAHPAGLRATTQVAHLILSGPSIRRKCHESAMSIVMEASWIVAVCNGSWSHFIHETVMYGYTTQDENNRFQKSIDVEGSTAETL
jgi:hypothetical protein